MGWRRFKSAQKGLLPFYVLGFLIVIGASLSSFTQIFNSILSLVLLVGCAFGVVRLVQNTYYMGFDAGRQTKFSVHKKKNRKNAQ